jgi:hypothetical protein
MTTCVVSLWTASCVQSSIKRVRVVPDARAPGACLSKMHSNIRRQAGSRAGIINVRCHRGKNRDANGIANSRWRVGFAASSARISTMSAAVWLMFSAGFSTTAVLKL